MTLTFEEIADVSFISQVLKVVINRSFLVLPVVESWPTEEVQIEIEDSVHWVGS
jgi:hypothetical protein